MSKTLTLRIEDSIYERLKEHAKCENRNLSNFIETAVIKYIEQIEFTDEQETRDILGNSELLERLNKGSLDAAAGRGRFV
jgi:predicted DNA-binding protein